MQPAQVGISVVITVRNEGRHLHDLFSSLEGQEEPFEIVIVDSESTDNTAEVVKEHSAKLDINFLVRKCTRGEGRNIGASRAKYPYLVFIDGDVTVGSGFLGSYRKLFAKGFELIAGKVVPVGVEKFKLDRVKLFYGGFEITHPSANLGYLRDRFQEIGGFDPSFVTAEDIDLNLRAVISGARYTECRDCVVNNRTRSEYGQFMRQAFWNGYGRRQLRRKNSAIWERVEKGQKIGSSAPGPNIIRLGFGALGYLYAMIRPR